MLSFEMSVTLPPAAQALRQAVFMEEQGHGKTAGRCPSRRKGLK